MPFKAGGGRRGERNHPGPEVTGRPPGCPFTVARRGRHARLAAPALRVRQVALLAAGTTIAIAAAMVIAAVVAVLCAAVLCAAGILVVAVRIPARWALWAGLVLSWPVAELYQGAGLIPPGRMSLVGGTAVLVAGCASSLTALRRGRQREWRQNAGRMSVLEGGRRKPSTADLARAYADLAERVTRCEAREREQEVAWEMWRHMTGRTPASRVPLRVVPDAAGDGAASLRPALGGGGFL